MKIEIHNLGPIHHFEFDLDKDIHLIYGKNSVGKSYAISTVYLILKNFILNKWSESAYYESINGKSLSFNGKKDIEFFVSLQDSLINRQDTTSIINNSVRYFLENSFLLDIEESILKNFKTTANIQNQYIKEGYYIKIETENYRLKISNGNFRDLEIVEFEHFGTILMYNEPNILLFDEKKQATAIFNDVLEKSYRPHHSISRLLSFFVNDLKSQIIQGLQALYFLPASRSGLEQAVKIIRKNKQSIIGTLGFSEPIEDYIYSTQHIDNQLNNKSLLTITQDIENEVIGGNIKYDNRTNQLNYYTHNLILEISQASSMQLELAPLVIYLKYIAQADSLRKIILFIEEPEAHLHPEVQVKLMEIFTELPKYGIKVVMTSHSNYMFNKLSNLILGGKVSADKVASYHLVMDKNKGSYDAKDMQATSEGIEDNNFVDVAEELYDERLRIIDKLNTQAKLQPVQ
ncbi:MAG: AAA family ATPase [Microscillaceae bacterium]|jgi:predicted ATP-dependent endonuclease of OLD family|nr:AAA family ATPase [Microscillaceae bacterium]